MLEKLKEIKGKDELIIEIALAAKKAEGTIENHWLGKGRIPEEYKEVVFLLIDRRLKWEKLEKKLHKKFNQENPIKLVKPNKKALNSN